MAEISPELVEKITSGSASPDEIKEGLKAVAERDIASLTGGEVAVGEVARIYDRGVYRVPLIYGATTRWFGLTPDFIKEHFQEMVEGKERWVNHLKACLEELRGGPEGTLGRALAPGWENKTLTDLKYP